ncbi:MAG TPA: hypothetical protein VMU41_02380 [Candidatus Binataceae bacterium]|nr:hypothetical protein [Candidatus Binataceae bacterium]
MRKSNSTPLYRLAARAARFAATAMLTLASANSAAATEFGPATFKILSPETSTLIGQVHFQVNELADGGLTVRSNARYTNGDTDNEEDRLAAPVKGGLPRQLTFSHDFFNPDGSLDRTNKADFVTGQATCTIYEDGQADVHSAKLDFPPDTYAGAPVVLPLRGALIGKVNLPIRFHYFTCVPSPRVVSVSAQVGTPAPWKYIEGDTVQVAIKPDFGWLNTVIAPFLPAVRAWFDPSRQWYLVGVESARYYRGPKILMVGDLAPTAASSH